MFYYANDILSIAASVQSLQTLLHLCEELMCINSKKSVCIRFGSRFDVKCSSITTLDGIALEWVDAGRYLGIIFVSRRILKCNFDNAEEIFYRSFNSIFSKVGRTASSELILHSTPTKCVPSLLFSLDACVPFTLPITSHSNDP